MSGSSIRELPNIIIAGTPGCGKTSHAELLAQQCPELKHINVSEFAKKNDCIEGWDSERDTSIVDEDKLLDLLEPMADKGGLILDWHCCDIFPERWIDLVVVLRCDNTVLYDRLEKRGYKESKVRENVECEIMEVLLSDARESYDPQIVIELRSENVDTLDQNVERICQWIDMWKHDHPDGISDRLPQ
ncbi:DEKNAAC104872 [Brettanomyces naardenensis]|uniref:Adenylate kinase isoenzyme 6 homolog n=1 Tax=Brettanomyces naardenensis TaxID=13370 RepID=A0A448YRW4_BRENA|nr:DEKNAAC104872 [Brettanomyces naardenensis]